MVGRWQGGCGTSTRFPIERCACAWRIADSCIRGVFGVGVNDCCTEAIECRSVNDQLSRLIRFRGVRSACITVGVTLLSGLTLACAIDWERALPGIWFLTNVNGISPNVHSCAYLYFVVDTFYSHENTLFALCGASLAGSVSGGCSGPRLRDCARPALLAPVPRANGTGGFQHGTTPGRVYKSGCVVGDGRSPRPFLTRRVGRQNISHVHRERQTGLPGLRSRYWQVTLDTAGGGRED